jgi:serine/threonine protein phosphatase PrpC
MVGETLSSPAGGNSVWKGFNITVRGEKHHRRGEICQDFSAFYSGGDMTVAVVCDGHGGDMYFRSDKGAKFAADAAVACIREFISHKADYMQDIDVTWSALVSRLEMSIITRWNQAVESDYAENGFTEDELDGLRGSDLMALSHDYGYYLAYGTTLIAVAVTPEFWFGIHIGDGKCAVVSDGWQFAEPIPWDENNFMGITTSMCNSNALRLFRSCFNRKLPDAVIIATDGIEESFADRTYLYGFYKKILGSVKSGDISGAKSNLEAFLPILSKKGSGDDLSIAVIYNDSALPDG